LDTYAVKIHQNREKAIQVLVNKNQDLIDNLLKSAFSDLANQQIIWTSPIEQDDFAEYRDNDFLLKVGLDPTEIKLNDFWPTKGPQWDALAKTTSGHVILVEAKANIPEIVSPGTGAGEISKTIIDKALNDTKVFLNLTNDIDWSGKFYQYTNL
jgi:type III secretion system FlhB-like substrate exporter